MKLSILRDCVVLYMTKNEICFILKELCTKNRLNFYDTIVLVLDQKREHEELLNKILEKRETNEFIDHSIRHIKSEKLFKIK